MVTLLGVELPTAASFPPTVPQLSVDAAIVAIAALVITYSIVAGYAALIRESVSIYVGLVLATTFGGPLYGYISDAAGSGFPVTQTAVNLILLILPMVLLAFGRRHGHVKHRHSIIATLVIAVATAMLLVASIINQLDEVMRSDILSNSYLAGWIYDFRLLWLALVPVAIAVSAIFKPKPHGHRH